VLVETSFLDERQRAAHDNTGTGQVRWGETGALLRTLDGVETPSTGTDPVVLLPFVAADGSPRLARSEDDGDITVLDLTTGATALTLTGQHRNPIESLSLLVPQANRVRSE
jgi:hypothetical protein